MMTHREVFDFGNRHYTVLSVARMGATWNQWLVLAIGLGLTLVAAAGYMTLWTIGRLRRKLAESINLGQYTLQEKIGEGGMGVVYRATHAMLRRPAAIKLLLKKTATENDLVRFEREVQLTSRLGHPNTISIFDYGRTADGDFYYVMEFLEGMDLDQLVREHGPLSPSRAIHILAQVSGALAEAHLMGLIHRDIKPANIVLTERSDEPDVVKVVDFGLVKTIERTDSQVGITHVDSITGTPLYLAPEAITAPDTVDGRSDIYALGGVAYFILTGQHVFEGKAVVEVLSKHLAEQPVPPSERLGRPLPADLEAVILSCLAKDRDARPASADRAEDGAARLSRRTELRRRRDPPLVAGARTGPARDPRPPRRRLRHHHGHRSAQPPARRRPAPEQVGRSMRPAARRSLRRDRALEDGQGLGEHRLLDGEREQEAHDVAVHSTGEQGEAGGQGAGLDRDGQGRIRLAALHQLDREHGPRTAHLGDARLAGAQALEQRAQPVTQLRPRDRRAFPPRSRRAPRAPRRWPAGCRRRCRPARPARARP